MARKPPRRTRERILEISLRLFNDLGEPGVNTTHIADEMRISPGNLYYHFRNKDDIVLSLYRQFEAEIDPLLRLDGAPAGVEDAWLFLHLLFELIWKYRYLYRDLGHLLLNNRTLETRFQALLSRKTAVLRRLCEALADRGELRATRAEIDALAENLVVVATWWLSYRYALSPRRFGDPAYVAEVLAAGCYHGMMLTSPYLTGDARGLFERLAAGYLGQTQAAGPTR